MKDLTKIKNNMSEVFRVKYKCKNCGNHFTETYGKGVRVLKNSMSRSAAKVVHRGIGEISRKISCPVCDIKSDVKIKNRSPILDEDEEQDQPLATDTDKELRNSEIPDSVKTDGKTGSGGQATESSPNYITFDKDDDIFAEKTDKEVKLQEVLDLLTERAVAIKPEDSATAGMYLRAYNLIKNHFGS